MDEHGQRAVIRDRATLRLVDLDTLTTHLLPWSYSALSVPDKVGLSGDGSLVALLVRSPTGDQQQIAFSPWPFHGAASVTDEQVPSPVDFVGAIVRDMAFKPGSHELLVVRSNGQLLLLNPDRAAPPAGNVTGGEVAPTATMPAAPVSPLTPWMQLDVPGTTVAFNRTGEYLAVACEDGVVRLISVTHREVRLRIPI